MSYNRQQQDPATLDVACPHCSMHVAKAVSVSTRKGDAGAVDVKMRCVDCQHTWIVQKLIRDEPPA